MSEEVEFEKVVLPCCKPGGACYEAGLADIQHSRAIVPQEDLAAAEAYIAQHGLNGLNRYNLSELLARHRLAERERCAKVASDHAQSCLMARGNAGAMNDRHAVWQAEAERLASESISAAIRAHQSEIDQ